MRILLLIFLIPSTCFADIKIIDQFGLTRAEVRGVDSSDVYVVTSAKNGALTLKSIEGYRDEIKSSIKDSKHVFKKVTSGTWELKSESKDQKIVSVDIINK